MSQSTKTLKAIEAAAAAAEEVKNPYICDDTKKQSIQRQTEDENRKRFVKPSKFTEEMDADRELSKFINNCNEIKAATAANKEGGQLSIVKPPPEPARAAKKET
ncbi:hypothetical protein OIU77_028449 [Salix suchowensis]|uniref:Uncharacterized protein n=1 Tax=Salix suchowensis TaxID=1278906 RepID=A0ABQ9BJI7_9ROSI|nr:hypothetical protein OIU77_028449 [Salix suchowensis]